MARKTRTNKKKVDKWVQLCCTVVEHAVVVDVLYLNSMINLAYENGSECR